jgi:hypothetical protein
LKLYFIVGGEKVKEVNITLSIRERERERVKNRARAINKLPILKSAFKN